MNEHRCGNCCWFRIAGGTLDVGQSGECRYPETVLPEVPQCERITITNRTDISPDYGKRCPVWSPKGIV